MSNTNTNLQTHTSNALHNAIMKASGKDRLPMFSSGNYVQWKSIIKRYIDTKPNNELIYYYLQNAPYKFKWTEKTVSVAEGSSETTTEGYIENYKNVSQDIQDQLIAEAEDVQIIQTGIDNDIYFIVDACPNAFLTLTTTIMEKVVTLVKQSQELKTVSYHKLYDILKQHQNEVNEIRAERLARTANPLAVVAQQQPVYHPQNHPNHYTQNSLTRSQPTATRNRGKAIINSLPPTYDQEPTTFAKDDEMSKENEIGKLMALLSLDDTDNEPKDQELKAHYMYMAQIQEVTPDAADNSGPIFDAEPLQKVQNNDDNYNVFAIESKHLEQPGSVNDTYLVERDEHNIIINSLDMSYDREQDDQDDNDDLAKEHDLFASLIAKLKCEIDDSKNSNQDNTSRINRGTGYDNHRVVNVIGDKETVDAAKNSKPVFVLESLQKIQNNDDNYNVFSIESEHPEQPKFVNDTYPVEQDGHNIIINSLDMSYDREQDDQDDQDDNDDLA
nr:hypothetical protein [Tanacetum cinerariifolium]